MRKIILILSIAIICWCNLCWAQDIIEFRVAYTQDRENTFKVHDEYSRVLYVENKPAIMITDVASARVIVDKSEPPEWVVSAAKMAGASVITPQVNIELILTDKGKDKFRRITSENVGNIIAIFINSELLMAPTIQDKIDGGIVIISTGYTEEEANILVDNLNQSIKKVPGQMMPMTSAILTGDAAFIY